MSRYSKIQKGPNNLSFTPVRQGLHSLVTLGLVATTQSLFETKTLMIMMHICDKARHVYTHDSFMSNRFVCHHAIYIMAFLSFTPY